MFSGPDDTVSGLALLKSGVKAESQAVTCESGERTMFRIIWQAVIVGMVVFADDGMQ